MISVISGSLLIGQNTRLPRHHTRIIIVSFAGSVACILVKGSDQVYRYRVANLQLGSRSQEAQLEKKTFVMSDGF